MPRKAPPMWLWGRRGAGCLAAEARLLHGVCAHADAADAINPASFHTGLEEGPERVRPPCDERTRSRRWGEPYLARTTGSLRHIRRFYSS